MLITMRRSGKALKKIVSGILMVAFVAYQAALPLSIAYAQSEPKVDICHQNGESGKWNVLNVSVNANEWQGHEGHSGDYLYEGPTEGGKPTKDGDKWCADNAPTNPPTPVDVCPNIPELQTTVPQGKELVNGNCVDIVVPPAPSVTISATKVVCDAESYLPNKGAGGWTIDATTAQSWVDGSAGKCKIDPTWQFQWGDQSAPDAGATFVGEAAGYTTFTAGTTTIPLAGITEIHLREVLKAGYIPFTGQNTTQNVSAEFYCTGDALNYDNWDFIRNPQAGQTYHCVGFNAPVTPPAEPQQCAIVSDTTNVIEGNIPAAETWTHSAWVNSTLLGSAAKWIWNAFKVVDPTVDETEVFTKQFSVTGTVSAATLEIAADNGYLVKVNGVTVVDKLSIETNYGAVSTHDVASYLQDGTNTLEITVKNFAVVGATAESNPAGLLYKLSITAGTCADIVPPPPLPQCVPSINLIENNSFEQPEVLYVNYFPQTDPLVKWFVSWVNPLIAEVPILEIQRNAGAGIAAVGSGSQFAELDSYHPTKIWQNIATVPTQQYSLTFKYSPRPGVNDNRVQVKLNDANLGAELAADGSANGQTDWQLITRTFTATSALSKIEFADGSVDNGLGGYIDDVRLSCVPSQNTAPDANAGVDQTLTLPTSTTTLDGSLSTDLEGPIASYVWDFVSGPSTINPSDVVNPSLTGLVAGTYVFTLTVTDINGATDTDTVSIIVNNPQGPTTTSNTTVVTPGALNGWFFFPENTNSGQTGTFVAGPTGQPLGLGSAKFMLTASNQGEVLGTFLYKGTRLDKMASLAYSTHLSTPGVALPALQFEFDNDLTDADTSFKGRLVYEPYYTHPVSVGVWQTWNPKDNSESSGNGNWWFSNGTLATNSGCSIATPCTWNEILALYPNAGVRNDANPLAGMTLFKAGSGSAFTSNVDKFVIGVTSGLNTHTETYDFEPAVCSDGISNDEDGLIDQADPACHSDGNAQNPASYTPDAPSELNGENVKQCSDGIDNDNDGKIDYINDTLGCSDASDDNETDPSQQSTPNGGGGGSVTLGGGAPSFLSAPVGQVLGASTSCGIYLDDYLKRGARNNTAQVKKLQEFLNNYLSLNPKLPVTGFFGPQTYAAVVKFQEQENDLVLKPWVGVTLKNSSKGTGYVYKTTKTRINNIMCPELNLPVPAAVID